MTARIILLVAIALAFLSGIAWASNLTGPEGGWMNKTLTGPIVRGGSVVPVAGALLLEDGTSILLLEDGSSSLCLEGGC